MKVNFIISQIFVRAGVFILLFVTVLPVMVLSQEQIRYKDSNLPFEDRARDLISRMTLEEKISQMVYNSPAIERLGVTEYNWWNEALHGVARNGVATVFPQAIGLAATWDPELMGRIAAIISDEARAKYNQAVSRNKRGIYQGLTLWSPNINIFRDPRWGRGMETYGEDPFLTGEMGVKFIKGLQGDDEKYLKTIATPKHFAVHSGPEPLRHTFNAEVSEYDLRETYLPHFKKCIQEGKAYSIMCAYNRFRGEPCCGSNLLIHHILRDEWGFEGLLVSDCWAIPDIYNYHKVVNTAEEASAMAVRAGTDLECGNAYPSLVNAVKEGLVSEKDIDTAVTRIFTARFKLGMFDPPEQVPYSNLNIVNSPDHKAAALESARKSIVLLKNENNILPLDKSNINTIAVIGPNADDVEVLLGNYNGFPSDPVTPLRGIQKKLPNSKVIFEHGCEVAENIPSFNIIPGSYFFTSEDKKQNGLLGEYFDNNNFMGKPAYTRIDEKIDFAWWDGAPYKEFDPDNYGVRWTGVLVPEKSGNYAIGGYGFNGFRIFIEDTLLVKFDGEFDPVKTYKYLNLTSGKSYRIKVEFYKKLRYSFMQMIWSLPDTNREQRAVEAAMRADVIIMVMGLSPRLEGEEMNVDVKGFRGGDRLTLDLPEIQSRLIKKIHKINKPIILVLLNGSAVSVNWENENIPAIIEAWYPGQAAGTAIADVLFGDFNPSGKLPVTFYKSVEQLPAFTDYNMDNRTYRYFKGEPLYPFGHGLSYTSFQIKNIKLQKASIPRGDSTLVSFDLSNTGEMKGDEVIQLYIKAEGDSRTVKTLKAFQRITLDAGETRKMEFKITAKELERWIDNKGFSVEADNYVIMIGTSSDDKDLQKINLKVESK